MFNSATVDSRVGLEYSEMTPMINHKKQFVYQKTKTNKEYQCMCRRWSSHDLLPDPLGSDKNWTVEITKSP